MGLSTSYLPHMAIAVRVHRPRSWRLPVPLLDLAIAALLVAAAVTTEAKHPGVVHPWTELTAAVAVGAVALRTRAPRAMVLITCSVLAVYAFLPATDTPLWTFLGVLVICFSVGAGLDGRRRLVMVGVLLATAYLLQLATSANEPVTPEDLYVSPLVIVGAPTFAGMLLRRSRQQTATVHRLAAELAAEREKHAQLAVLAERSRLARELHDVISHAVTVMVVQAGAAEQLLQAEDPARGHVHAVRSTGKQALAELRRQLGLMREGRPASPSPLPGLAEVRGLAEETGAELRMDPELPAVVAPGLGLTVYRVVQEALTNAHRHAPGAPVRVRLRRDGSGLEVLVDDDGAGTSAVQGAGQGLAGMRERVEMYGGHLDVGPRGDGRGWRVRVVLPVPQEATG
jgi:signal transduction histidine kinase